MSQNSRAGRLYQEIILDHYKHPHHKGLRDPFEAEVHHVNPTCGDPDEIGEVTEYVLRKAPSPVCC